MDPPHLRPAASDRLRRVGRLSSTPARSRPIQPKYRVWVRKWMSRDRLALVLGLLAPFAVSAVLVPFRDRLANTDVALVLVVVVVAIAANGYRVAGILAALSAGVWFDFFFTEPFQRLTIADRSDIETFVLLLVVGIAVTELAVWGRRQQSAREPRSRISRRHPGRSRGWGNRRIVQRVDQGGL